MNTEEAVQANETAAAPADTMTVEEPQSSHGDEFMVLVVGFTIGMMIAFGFLVYIVLAAAGYFN